MQQLRHSRNLKPNPAHFFKLKHVAAIVLAGSVSWAAQADATPQNFNIPALPLDNALTQLADQAGVRLLYSAELTGKLRSPALSGQYTPEQALKILLRGSGLNVHKTADDAFTLEQLVNAVEPQSNQATLGAVTVEGVALLDANDPYNKDYKVTHSSVSTKTDTPVMESPTSVQVVSRAVMDDQKVSRITDALENVSGVRAQPSLGIGNNFIIRGFQNNNIYRNGLRSNNVFPQEYDAANLQNIEVLKGPAQLYGRTEPGGLISLTTKKPLDIPYYSLEQRFGSYDLYRTEWDATGPLNQDKTLLYRFSGSYQDNQSFRDFNFNQRMLFAPSITWRPNDATDATIDLQVNNQDFMADFGIPVIGKRPAQIPISRSLGDPNTPKSNLKQVQLGTLFNHRFNDDWAIHSRFLASFDSGDETFVNPAPAFDPATAFNQTTGLMQRNIFNEINEGEAYSTNLDVTGKFDLGFSKHEVLMGFDFNRAIETYDVKGLWVNANPALAINIFNPSPSYGIPRSVFDNALALIQRPGRDHNVFLTQWEGVYFQDQITLWDKLHIMGGGRYDWTETGRGRGGSFGEANANVNGNIRSDEGFSPRVGILYQPFHELSVFGNWTTSFGANNAPADNGATFDPQIGEQFEAGIKTQLFDDRLLATVAYYHLSKDNILVNNSATPDPFDKVANNQRSQGIELDLTGQLSHSLSVIGSYAFTDARVIKDFSDGTQGNRLANVPEHSGSLWLKYDVNGFNAPQGLSVGLGGVAAGQREGDFANSFQLPGYVRMDAFAAYKMKVGPTKITTSFNIRNLLDKTYYESTDPDANVAPALGVAPGAPLTAIGSIRVEY